MATGTPIGILLALTMSGGSPPPLGPNGPGPLAIGIGIGIPYLTIQTGGNNPPPPGQGTPVGLLMGITQLATSPPPPPPPAGAELDFSVAGNSQYIITGIV